MQVLTLLGGGLGYGCYWLGQQNILQPMRPASTRQELGIHSAQAPGRAHEQDMSVHEVRPMPLLP